MRSVKRWPTSCAVCVLNDGQRAARARNRASVASRKCRRPFLSSACNFDPRVGGSACKIGP